MVKGRAWAPYRPGRTCTAFGFISHYLNLMRSKPKFEGFITYIYTPFNLHMISTKSLSEIAISEKVITYIPIPLLRIRFT